MPVRKHVLRTEEDTRGFALLQTCLVCGYKIAGNGRVLFILDENYKPIPGEPESVGCLEMSTSEA